jgi:prepilin-type N-terminal cleavage/methylation domain-containing protein
MPAARHRLVGTSVRDRVSARLHRDEGFGLIELLIAMLVMALGIMAIVAGFSSGIVALSNASRTGTAGTLADKQMEAYRALPYTSIALRLAPSLGAAPDTTYTGDPALSGSTTAGNFDLTTGTGSIYGTSGTEYGYCSTGSPVTCTRVQTPVSGPDGRSYRIDTYVVWSCAAGTLRPANGTPSVTVGSVTYTQTLPGCLDATTNVVKAQPVKQVTVVVRDAATPSKTYVRETSTFDAAT